MCTCVCVCVCVCMCVCVFTCDERETKIDRVRQEEKRKKGRKEGGRENDLLHEKQEML